ncbi:hypothetical protein VII00023_06507 [Vibrio ichthyoenteri ATCC 700023]|uniref:Uncharacterized protein n=1 Tax=Vibrio ichthyoenteri ATCC 700023 TaxID=870968 RepID=F9S6L3_9VIBR|nr:hypothetical protein [Vibrio ichthyoenteri]EGU32670.1 hypothetical protein VII00023_06507 [Vibrio ichthyoenteri ATCC 700023]
MNLMSLQLDSKAQAIAAEWLDGLEQEDGWFKMTVRIAAQIDAALREHHYEGVVMWYSEEDYIEERIEYHASAQ